jgi:hypothetical protein
MLRQLLFPDAVPAEQIVLDAARGLLEPLVKTMPEVVEATMQAIQAGQTPLKAGEALAKALHAREKMTMDEERNKQAAIVEKIADLESKLNLQAREITQLKASLEREEKETMRKDKLIGDYQETIESQNRLLAEQHKKLSSLFR